MPSDLKKLHNDPVGCVWDSADGPGVLHVNNGHALTKASGYLKFLRSRSRSVLFRGQGQIYDGLTPSLYRKVKQQDTMHRRDALLKKYIKDSVALEAFIPTTPEYAHEPLLQHYGVRTKWLDVVDNVWIALWFAAHTAISFGKCGESLHFERRRQNYASKSENCYILMIEAPGMQGTEKEPGLYMDDEIMAIDLRKAIPSVYLRPHSQHGLLVRNKRQATVRDIDLTPYVAGVIRVSLRDALEWLGDSTLLSVHTLFPPPLYDRGFARLMELAPKGSEDILSIASVAP